MSDRDRQERDGGGRWHYRASVSNPVPFDPAPQAYDSPPPGQAGPNGLAIGALVAAICGGPGLGTVLGVGLGVAALIQIRRRPQKGAGFAVAALAVSSLTLVFTILVTTGLVLGALRDRITGVDTVGATDLRTGHCISDIDESVTVHDMPVVPCTQPHKAEVYHVFEFPPGVFPGRSAVAEESSRRCVTAFQPYDTSENSDLEVYYLFPEDAAGWAKDRSVQCIAAAPVVPRTGSILN